MDSNRYKSDDEYSIIGDKGEIGFLDYQNDQSVCNYNPHEEGPVIISVPFPLWDGKPQSVFVGETAADKITIENTTKEPLELWTKIYASTPEDSFLLSLMPPPSVDDGNSKQEFIGLFNLEDRMLEPGDTLTIWLSCKPTGIGLCTSAVHFDVGYDRIERVVFLLAEDKVSQSLASRKPYSRVARKKQFDVDVYVPGSRPTKKGDRRYRSRLPRYDIPKDIRELIENNQEPAAITAGLSRENYACFFKTLLIIEEIQLEENMRAYNMEGATMKRKGNYLSLVVPGLAEKRPSIVHGDYIFIKNVDEDESTAPYQGFVHRVEADEVYLKFAPEFHLDHIEGNLYNVHFTYSRINMRRQYQALDAAECLATELLFPSESSENRLIETTALMPLSANLNEEQISAVEKILGCRGGAPYVIFGPPGTGKTKTIVEAILQIYRNYNGSRILVCAPSNSAADYLLEKLLTEKAVNVREIKIFRLNAPARQFDDISPDYIRFCFFDEFVFKCPSLKALSRYRIIISTYMGAALLNAEGVDRGHFSHIFLDEAGQASEPESMIPISNLCQMDTVVVLAGDPLQLGPVIFSKQSEACGLGKSYLERLFECEFYCDGDENYVTKLIRNYRCHPDILFLPSTLFYGGELIACKDSTDDTTSLLSSIALLPGNNFSVLFFGIQGCDEREGNNPSWFNRFEASKVVEIIKKLITRGNLSDADIGVITPYRQQVLKLKKALEDMDMPDVKVGSVEQFQGQEKKVIIVSSVRSTIKHNEFDKTYCLGFLSNPRRFNVAITRAIALLIIVGNPHIVSQDPNWNELLWYCVDNKSYQGCGLPERQDYNDQTGVSYGEEPGYSEGPLRGEADSSYGWKTNPVSNNGWESKPVTDEAGWSDGWKTNPASANDWQPERGKDEAEWSDGWKE